LWVRAAVSAARDSFFVAGHAQIPEILLKNRKKNTSRSIKQIFLLCYKGMARNILGKGWAFPVGPDLSGALGMVAYERSVEESIRIILGTAPGERLMRPDFGCRIHEMVFAPDCARTVSLAEHYVREALLRWEPRVIVKEVRGGVDGGNPGLVNIRIDYEIRSVNTFFNMVYPFYLERGERDSQRQFG
jgi:phage baseplate assembly protein W